MMDVMYRIPSDDDIAECIITREAVLGKEKPKLIMRDNMCQADQTVRTRKNAS